MYLSSHTRAVKEETVQEKKNKQKSSEYEMEERIVINRKRNSYVFLENASHAATAFLKT